MENYLKLCYYPLFNKSTREPGDGGEELTNASFTVWYNQDFGLCFEYLVFSAFLGAFFGVASALYAGLNHSKIKRKRKSLVLIARGLVSLCILITVLVDFLGSFWLARGRPYSVMVSLFILIFSWSIHLLYVCILSCSVTHYGWGPLNLNAIWILTFVGNILHLRTVIRWKMDQTSYQRSSLPIEDAYFSNLSEIVVYVLFGLQCLYGLTLFFKVSRVTGDNVKLYPAHYHIQKGAEWSDDAEKSVREHLISSKWKTDHVPSSYGSLTSSYVSTSSGLTTEMDFGRIDASEDNANPLSRLSFWWVGPLMKRGALGLLQKPEDLLLLPNSLKTSKLRNRFRRARGVSGEDATQFLTEGARKDDRECRNGGGDAGAGAGDTKIGSSVPDDGAGNDSDMDSDSEIWYDSLSLNIQRKSSSATEQIETQDRKKKDVIEGDMSLFQSLNKAFGVHFYPLGILKLLADMLGFSGPLLLHALVSFMEKKNVRFEVRTPNHVQKPEDLKQISKNLKAEK